jgi:DNA-binding CsgD family transcriptional regulator
MQEKDLLLDDLAPVLADLLVGLTARQRTVARLALVDGLRQSEVAARLNVRRATISVSFSRARVQALRRQADAIRRVFSDQGTPALGMAPAGSGQAGPTGNDRAKSREDE